MKLSNIVISFKASSHMLAPFYLFLEQRQLITPVQLVILSMSVSMSVAHLAHSVILTGV